MDEGSLSDTQRTMVLPLLQETNIRGKPYITVSSKGIVNGLSNIPNDGADFGPDTTLGATAPGQYGSPYTQSTGIQEAWNYALSIAYYLPSTDPVNPDSYDLPEIHLSTGPFNITEQVTFSGGTKQINTFKLSGEGGVSTDIRCNTPSEYAIVIDPDTTQNTVVVFSGFSFDFGNSIGFVQWNFTSAPSGEPDLIWHDINCGTGSAGSYIAFIGSNTSGVTGLFSIFIDGNISDTDTIYLSATYVYFNGSSHAISVNTGNSNYVHIQGAYSVWLGNTVNLADISNLSSSGTNTIYIGSSSASTIYGNISLHTLNNTAIVMNTNINGTLSIENAQIGVSNFQSVPVLKSNGYYVNQLYMNNIWADISSVLLTDGTLVCDNIKISNLYPISYFNNIPVNVPTLSANPPVSGTAYQNTNPYAIRLKIPVTYNPTTTAAATLATGISSTSTVTTTTKVSIPSGLTAADGEILTYDMVVPAGQYFELVATNATIGTVEVQAA